MVKLAPMLYLVKAPLIASKETSPPTTRSLFRRAAEKLRIGLDAKQILEVSP